MEPPVDIRLQSMTRAVADVIVPALDKKDGLAAAQAELLLAHLTLLRRQIDHLPAYYRLEHQEALKLGRALVDAAAGGPTVGLAACRLRDELEKAVADDNPHDDPAFLRESTETLQKAGESLVRSMAIDGESSSRDSVLAIAVSAGRAAAQRQLRWFDSGSDPATVLDEWRMEMHR